MKKVKCIKNNYKILIEQQSLGKGEKQMWETL